MNMFLEIRDVVAGYLKGVDVLQGINLHVEAGELVCMIGPNGAGKSTVLRTISGLLKPSRGEIIFENQEISGLRPDLVLKYGIITFPGSQRFSGDDRSREYLDGRLHRSQPG